MSADIEFVPTPMAPRVSRRLPGVEGVWVFVFADMAVFALMFGCFMWDRHLQPESFEVSRRALDLTMGGVNTLILLTSSMLVVLAIDALKYAENALAPVFLGLATLCGLAFIVNKAFEYREKFEAGIGLQTNDFFMYYFIMTGMHLGHVVVGTVILAALALKARSSRAGGSIVAYEGGATYWHMVDLLWVCLFPLLYLVR
ncbi:MAG: heme/copper-type cytochrome/quinol oxidase, subunit 3 [Panacagrimonas sp.]|jgi:nitric oxide reductase NorE protein|nr:cytochrome c oxidase subunit 3 [Panacagrimonas sp.]MCC2654924.1 heme/copper-type cytochrome/quinol oxidase, subunit 3 [Panacagrimonas sp.]